ncbi:MAG: response regulator transcription factor [Bacteroidota bacterium]
MNTQILLVEDDLNLGFLLMEFLEDEGYQVKLCRDGESGLQQVKCAAFDLCILDIMLPKMDGYDLARSIKKEHADLPFLFLSAKSLKEDRLKGYAIGAEDYLMKPFDEDELLCKIKVILRNQSTATPIESLPTQFTIGDYFFDYNRHELTYGEITRRITVKENEVLRLLCLNQNQVLNREEAVEQIYGKRDYFLGRSFDVFISRLRKLLKNDPRIHIENVFKVGFILKVPEGDY